MFSRVAIVSNRVALRTVNAHSIRAFTTRNVAGNIFYSKEHEYVRFDSADTGYVGLSDFAQNSLGDLVYVDLPDVGSDIAEGTSFASVESVKSANDVYAPVSGTVVEVNDDLSSTPELINQAPETDAWLVKIQLSDIDEVDKLMTPDEYEAYCETL